MEYRNKDHKIVPRKYIPKKSNCNSHDDYEWLYRIFRRSDEEEKKKEEELKNKK